MAMRNSGFARGVHPYPGVPYPSPLYRSPTSPMPPPLSEFCQPHLPSGPFGPSILSSPASPSPLLAPRGAVAHFPGPFRPQRFSPYRVPQKNGIPKQTGTNKNVKKNQTQNNGVAKDVSNNNANDSSEVTIKSEPAQEQKDAKDASNGTNSNAELKVPPELMEPLFCKLCDIKLNGTLQANAHYEGKSHAKKVRQYLDKLRKEKGITTPLPTTNGKTEPKEKKNQPAEMYCKLCDVAFTSDIQAKQHHNGRNHQRRLRGEPPLPKGFYNAVTGKWQRQPPAGVTYHAAPQAKRPQEFECTICNSKMTSQAQLDAHLAGSKHRAKVASQTAQNATVSSDANVSASSADSFYKAQTAATHVSTMSFVLPGYTANTGIVQNGQIQPSPESSSEAFVSPKAKKFASASREYCMFRTPSGKYYCSSCNLSLNSDVQLAQHFGSKKHKAKMATQRRTGTTA